MPFTDGNELEPMNVICQSTEDDADDAIVPRFISAGGNTEKLLFINEKEHSLSFSDERLLEAIKATKAKLIILDPLSTYIGESSSINSANEVGQICLTINKPNERLFPTTKSSLYRAIKKYSELAGVKKNRIHDLRHSHASLLIEKGVPPLTISERLGHEDIQTTLNTYSHLYPNK